MRRNLYKVYEAYPDALQKEKDRAVYENARDHHLYYDTELTVGDVHERPAVHS